MGSKSECACFAAAVAVYWRDHQQVGKFRHANPNQPHFGRSSSDLGHRRIYFSGRR
jgi:hypothetical protein